MTTPRSTLQIWIAALHSEVRAARREKQLGLADALRLWDSGRDPGHLNETYHELVDALLDADLHTGAAVSPETTVLFFQLAQLQPERDARNNAGRWPIAGEPWKDVPNDASWRERALAFLLWRSNYLATPLPQDSKGRPTLPAPAELAHQLALLGYTRLTKTMLAQQPDLFEHYRPARALDPVADAAVRWNDLQLTGLHFARNWPVRNIESHVASEAMVELLLEQGYAFVPGARMGVQFRNHNNQRAADKMVSLVIRGVAAPEDRLKASLAELNVDALQGAMKLLPGYTRQSGNWQFGVATQMLLGGRFLQDKAITPWFRKAFSLATQTPESAMVAPGIPERQFQGVLIGNLLRALSADEDVEQSEIDDWKERAGKLPYKYPGADSFAAMAAAATAAGHSELRPIWAGRCLRRYLHVAIKDFNQGRMEASKFALLAQLSKLAWNGSDRGWTEYHMSDEASSERFKALTITGGKPSAEEAAWVMALQVFTLYEGEINKPPKAYVRLLQNLEQPQDPHDARALSQMLASRNWEGAHAGWLAVRDALKASLVNSTLDQAIGHGPNISKAPSRSRI